PPIADRSSSRSSKPPMTTSILKTARVAGRRPLQDGRHPAAPRRRRELHQPVPPTADRSRADPPHPPRLRRLRAALPRWPDPDSNWGHHDFQWCADQGDSPRETVAKSPCLLAFWVALNGSASWGSRAEIPADTHGYRGVRGAKE